MNSSLISIIVPCYNIGDYLSETLDCLIRQTVQDWECIIINDGSTDHTHEIAMSYVKKDRRFQYIKQENQGLSASRNKGLQNAKGEFIQFLDADDLLGSDKFENQLAAFRKNRKSDIIYSEYLCFRNKNINNVWTYSRVLIKGSPLKDFILNWERDLSIPIHCFLYRRSCFSRWGQFDETLPNHEDWDIHIRFAIAGARYTMIPGRTAFYRIREHSMARNLLGMARGRELVINKHGDDIFLNFQLKLALGERKVETFFMYLKIFIKKDFFDVKYLDIRKMIRSFLPFHDYVVLLMSIIAYLVRTIIRLPFKKRYTKYFFIKGSSTLSKRDFGSHYKKTV